MGNSKQTITVKTESGDVVVRKLALGDYAALLRALNNLPSHLGGFLQDNEAEDLKDNTKLFALLPDLIADALPEFCNVLSAVSDRDADFYLEGDLADAIDVFVAALELNNYKRVIDSVKKLMARGKQQKELSALQSK